MLKTGRKWVLVEAISQYRTRYLVEVPHDHPEYALDTVTMDEAREFSQEWLGETIVSHRVVSHEEALRQCREDNGYTPDNPYPWSDEKVAEVHFTLVDDVTGRACDAPEGEEEPD